MTIRMSRRNLLQRTGILLTASSLWPAQRRRTPAPIPTTSQALPEHPNLLFIITDQERYPRWWPAGWVATNLPNRQRIAANGLTFTQAFCNSCMCSPSRSTLFTGLYPAQHGVEHTLTTGGTLSATEPKLPLTIQNMAKMLASAGYNVHYRGKWHMSKGSDGGDPSSPDVAAYGFSGWVPPEAGEDTDPNNFGGGCANRDAAYATQAADFLSNADPNATTPFALIVSFANPHDVLAYPRSWDQQDDNDPNCFNYKGSAPDCFNQGIGLPDTYTESLTNNFKPTTHAQTLNYLAIGLGTLLGPKDPERYVNFYAFLQKVVDQHMGTVLDALEAKAGLKEKTVIIRMADHGELGLAHGGLRQKMFNAYEETMNVPLVIANPLLFPQPATTNALASLIDIMPTLATLANVPNRQQWTFKGRDLTPLLTDPTAAVQDAVLFTFDDQNAGAKNGQNVVTQPNHIRCLREAQWKFVMYFDPTGATTPQYELYDLVNDPTELHNLANAANTAYYNPTKVTEMQAKLATKMVETGTLPYHVALPLVTNE